MKAKGVVFTAPESVEVWDLDIPEPGPEEVLVRVTHSGISMGTEGWILKNKYKGVTYPLVTGYQNCGVVERVGSAVTNVAEGDRVFTSHGRLLSDVRPMWAGHLSHIVTPGSAVIPVPEGVASDAASLGVMPGVPWRGIQMTGINEGDLVVVIGLGLVGQFALQLALIKGARVIALEVRERRRLLAAKHGGAIVLDPLSEDVLARVQGEKEAGADVIIDTSANSQAVNESFDWIRPGGRYCFQGYYPELTCLDLYLPHFKQLTFYNPTSYEGIDTMFSLIAQGQLNVGSLITHRFAAEQAPQAYGILLERPQEALGMVLEWPQG